MTTCSVCAEFDRWIAWAKEHNEPELVAFLEGLLDLHVNDAGEASWNE